MLLPLATFFAVVLGVACIYSFTLDLGRSRMLVNQRLEQEFLTEKRDRLRLSPLFKNLDTIPAGLPPADVGLEAPVAVGPPPGRIQRLQEMLDQSGLRVTLGGLCIAAVIGALAGGFLAGMLLGPVLGVTAATLAAAAPFAYLYLRWRARIEKLTSQLPDAFDLMARVIRAGHSVPQALQAVADEFEPPVATEFAFCQEQQNLGLLPEVTFRELAQRTGVVEIKIFVMAMLIQRQTGGNLTELLERLASLVRDRIRIRGHVKALTAEGRLQAIILLLLPPVMFLVMMGIYPEYAGELLEHTGLIAAMVGTMALGALWIHRIVNFEI
jgi:tight adherence protein B